MTIALSSTVIGLTGPFGSGCTTTAGILSAQRGYTSFLLSSIITNRWKEKHSGRSPQRADLQALGNEIRMTSKNPGALAEIAIGDLERSPIEMKLIVIDGIRNIGEIEFLRERFGRRFYLFALECPASERWVRIKEVYAKNGLTIEDFLRDNEQDRLQEYAHGQQVQLCVDKADVLLSNDKNVVKAKFSGFSKKLLESLDLVTGAKPRYANPAEILMNLAYSAAHGSKCLKRQVGAVLVEAPPKIMGQVVGQGFNENPIGTLPCVEEPRYGAKFKGKVPGACYRDMVRHKSFVELARLSRHCPGCGQPMKEPIAVLPPWRCGSCGVDLEEFFWPERAMTLCTAVHAEVSAILAAGSRAKGTTLYTTTFPCFQCSEKIAQSGVKHIVFTEPYPDIRAAERLEIAHIEIERFEGIRSSRFDEIFSRARPYVSAQQKVIAAKLKS
jgi:deoxycytidylate deaminase/dephospho-CoA kinase